MALKYLKRKLLNCTRSADPKLKKIDVKGDSFHSYGSIMGGDYSTEFVRNPRPPLRSHSLGINALPDSILLAIARHLPPDDVNNLRLLNRRCNKLVKKHSSLLLEYRHLEVRVHQSSAGIVQIVTMNGDGRENYVECPISDLSKFLCRVSMNRIDISGRLCDNFLNALDNIRAKRVSIKDAKITCSPSKFSQSLRLFNCRSLVICRCKFGDAHLISDELFENNPQIRKVKIRCTDSNWQSFPLLTDRTLLSFSVNGLPKYFLFENIETNIRIEGIALMIKAARLNQSTLGNFRWSFGRILSTSAECRKKMVSIDDVTVAQIHGTQMCVLTDDEPDIRAIFFTKIDRTQYDKVYYGEV